MTSFEKNTKTIIAKVIIGQEYLYDRKYYQVSKAKADIICNAMNESNYELRKGEMYKVFHVSDYTWKNAFYRIVLRNGKAFFYEIWKAAW